MMDTEIFKIDAPWAEKLRKTRVPFLSAPTVLYFERMVTPANSMTHDVPYNIKLVRTSFETFAI